MLAECVCCQFNRSSLIVRFIICNSESVLNAIINYMYLRGVDTMACHLPSVQSMNCSLWQWS